jgi:hypothetical protein
MSQGWSAEKMLELGRAHAGAEARADLEATMATMVAEPFYEFHPIGLSLSGGDAVRRWYRQFYESFLPKTAGYRLLEEWVTERSLAQEYDIALRIDGAVESFRVIGILYAEGELLGGERLYASERFFRQLAGPMFEELAPLAPWDPAG